MAEERAVPTWIARLPRYRIHQGLSTFLISDDAGPLVKYADLIAACPPQPQEMHESHEEDLARMDKPGNPNVPLTATTSQSHPTIEPDDGSYLWKRCYICGHRLRFASDGCPQCGIHFDGRPDPERWPEQCECARCVDARKRP